MAHKINDNGTDRNMTPAEETAYLAWVATVKAEAETQAEAKAERAVAREALLTRLGLTEQEAQLLLGS